VALDGDGIEEVRAEGDLKVSGFVRPASTEQ
jgi:hypothetical protein